MRDGSNAAGGWNWRVGVAGSLLVHVLMLVILLTQAEFASRGSKAPSQKRSLLISLAAPASKPAPRATPSPPAPTPPQPVEPPKEERQPTPEPTPIPAKPKPAGAEPKKPVPAAASPTPPSNAAETPGPPPPDESEEDSLIGLIHSNWLEPVNVPRTFRCRIHIDYLAGGMISAVKFLQGCGSYALDESVRRAVWKTQPLPGADKKAAAGTIEIDFTP